jgi:hypothetical protein
MGNMGGVGGEKTSILDFPWEEPSQEKASRFADYVQVCVY